MMKQLLMTIVFLLLIINLNAQESFTCLIQNRDSMDYSTRNGSCQPDDHGSWLYYRNLNQYIPNMDSVFPLHVPPIKTIW